MNNLPFVGDIVTIDLSKFHVKSDWEPLSKIKGVVVHLVKRTGSPTMAQVIWTEPAGLSLHWRRDHLIIHTKKEAWPKERPANTDPSARILD